MIFVLDHLITLARHSRTDENCRFCHSFISSRYLITRATQVASKNRLGEKPWKLMLVHGIESSAE